MANTKSAIKNIRKNRTRYLRNRAVSSRLKTLEKKFRSAILDKNKELAQDTSKAFISALDKAQKTNLVHSNKVARKKARCFSLLSEI